jgi:hypothetical protein
MGNLKLGNVMYGWTQDDLRVQKLQKNGFLFQPKIRMYSKYERRTDTRTYEDRRKLYEGVSYFTKFW